MTEDDAIDALMAHITHRMNEFFNDCKAEEIAKDELGTRFARWLAAKESPNEYFSAKGGGVGQLLGSDQCIDEQSMVMARLMMFKDHGVGFMWMADLFTNPAYPPFPDELRTVIVETLRFHADRLEDHDIDRRMQEITPKGGMA